MSKISEKIDWIKKAKGPVMDWAKKYVKKIILAAAIFLVVLTVLKVSILLGLYFFFSNLIAETTGLDHSYVRSLSILSVVFTLMTAPTILGLLTFKSSKKSVATIVIAFTAITIGIVKYKSGHIFFDSSTGAALSYYVKTPNGYKFTVDADKKYDPTFGDAYKPVTREVVLDFIAENDKSEIQINNLAICISIIFSVLMAIFCWCWPSFSSKNTSNGSIKINQDKQTFFVAKGESNGLELTHKGCCGGVTKFHDQHLRCGKCGFDSYFGSSDKADFLAAAHQVAEKKVTSTPFNGWMLLPEN